MSLEVWLSQAGILSLRDRCLLLSKLTCLMCWEVLSTKELGCTGLCPQTSCARHLLQCDFAFSGSDQWQWLWRRVEEASPEILCFWERDGWLWWWEEAQASRAPPERAEGPRRGIHGCGDPQVGAGSALPRARSEGHPIGLGLIGPLTLRQGGPPERHERPSHTSSHRCFSASVLVWSKLQMAYYFRHRIVQSISGRNVALRYNPQFPFHISHFASWSFYPRCSFHIVS